MAASTISFFSSVIIFFSIKVSTSLSLFSIFLYLFVIFFAGVGVSCISIFSTVILSSYSESPGRAEADA